MFNRRRHRYSHRSSLLMPTLAIVLVSLVAALGGAIYWDKQQEEARSKDVTSIEQRVIEEEEITLPDPEADGVVLTAEEEKAEEAAPEEEKPFEEEASEESSPEAAEDPTEEAAPPQEEETVTAIAPISTAVKASEEVDPAYFTDAVFVGDSLTQGIQLYDIIDTTVLANKGINLQSIHKNDKIRVAEGYTGVLPELERIKPDKVYVQLGMNDIAWRTQGDFIKLYGTLIDEIKDIVPDATLYIQSIFPVTGWYSKEDNGIDNDKVLTYNQALAELAAEKGCYYLDVHSALINENGVLPDEASPDGIHLNGPYYQRWFSYLKTHTAQ